MTEPTAPRLVLHVGAMKTGTTYLQDLLQANVDVLGEAGWAVPEQGRVVRGVRQVMSLTDKGRARVGEAPRWDELMDQARAHDGLGTVVSMEFLSFARRPRLQQILATTHGLDLRVVITVRDAVRALPSQWQSLSRNGGTRSWPEFAEAVRAGGLRRRDPGAKAFRRTQDIPRMLEVWSRAAAPEHFTAITVPASGSGLPRTALWDRFLHTLSVDPAGTRTDTAFDNPQLGYGSCELLRLLNGAGLQAERPSAYRRVVRRLTREHLLDLREQQTRPRMDRATARFAADLNARTRARIAQHATLLGDLDDLPTDLGDAAALDPGPRPVQVAPEEVLRAAVALHHGALALCEEERLALPAELAESLPDDLDRAVQQLARVMGVAITGDVSHRPQPSASRTRPSTFQQ